MYRISSINVFPIKSLGGVDVQQATAEFEGLKWDRRWMLVDEEGNFLTQREHPILSVFKCALSSDSLRVNYQDAEIEVPFNQIEPELHQVKVWSNRLKAQEVATTYSDWFSELLNRKCKLVRMTDESSRYKRLYTAPYKSKLSFADGYPFLILGSSSMEYLNSKLEKPLNIDRFRANIIVDTEVPHEEDLWREIKIGEAQLKVIKPCSRCVMTTIDQATAQKGKEPLKTLATYRKKANNIMFGANAVLIKSGQIRVGDTLALV